MHGQQIVNSSSLDPVHADIVFLQSDTTLKYHLAPYSGKLSWEKTFASWWKKDFRGQNFCGLLAGATKRPCPRISPGKLLQIPTKPGNS